MKTFVSVVLLLSMILGATNFNSPKVSAESDRVYLANVSSEVIQSQLGIDNEFPSIKKMYYLVDTYFAQTDNDLYRSTDLQSWTKVKDKFYGYVGGDGTHIVLVDEDGNLSYSTDGVNWTDKKYNNRFFRAASNKGSVLIQSDKDEEPLKLDNFTVYFFKMTYGAVSTGEGQYIRSLNKRVEVSEDCESWNVVENTNGIKSIEMLPINKDENIYFSAKRDIYKLVKNGSTYKAELVEDENLKTFAENLGYLYGNQVDRGPINFDTFIIDSKQSTDILLSHYYAGLDNAKIMGDKLFIYGNKGIAYYSNLNDLQNWTWCGLYNMELLDVTAGMDLSSYGIHRVKDVYLAYLYNPEYNYPDEERIKTRILVSSDGVKWDEFLYADLIELVAPHRLSDIEIYLPEIVDDTVVVDCVEVGLKLYFDIEEGQLVLAKKEDNHVLRIPPSENDLSYLGMNGGYWYAADAAKEGKVLDILRLDKDAPTLKTAFNFNNKFYVLASNQVVYTSKRLNGNGWKKAKWSWPKNMAPMFDKKNNRNPVLFTNDAKRFVVMSKRQAYVTTNGVKWKKLYSKGPKTKALSNLSLAKKRICVIDKSIKKRTVKKYGKITMIRLPAKTYSQVATNGHVFAASYKKQPKKAKVIAPIVISKNGLKWHDLNISGALDEKSNTSTSRFTLIYYRGKNYLVYEDQECCSGKMGVYRISYSNGKFKKREIDYRYYDKAEIKTAKDFVLTIVLDTFRQGRKVLNKDKFYSYADDSFILADFSERSHELTSVYCNNNILFLGDWGSIFRVNKNMNVQWAGLYKREPLSITEIEDANIGGVLGIRKYEETYWYANRFEKNDYNLYYVGSSPDGTSWRFEFESDKRVPLEWLQGDKLKSLREGTLWEYWPED